MLNKQMDTMPAVATVESTALALNNLTVRFNLAGELVIEDDRGQTLDTEETLAQLTAQGRLSALLSTVCVPTQLVLLTEVFVPGKRKSDWVSALPYALEESLSEPVENFHFVVLNRTQESMVSVAIVAHERIQAWIEHLSSVGLEHAQLIPDCFRVPFQRPILAVDEGAHVWCMAKEKHVCYIRQGNYLGFSVNEDGVEVFKNAVQSAEKTVSITRLNPSELKNSQGRSDPMVSSLNLRTGDYQAHSKSLNYWQEWRWPALFIGLLLATSLAFTWQKTQALVEQTAIYQAQTEQLFKEMFPNVKRIVNIKMQAQTRLNNQTGGGEKKTDSLMQLLQAIEPLFQDSPDVGIQSIKWQANAQGGQLTVFVEAEQTQSLQRIVTMSQQQNKVANVSLELKNVTPSLVEGVLHVNKK